MINTKVGHALCACAFMLLALLIAVYLPYELNGAKHGVPMWIDAALVLGLSVQMGLIAFMTAREGRKLS